MFSFVFIHLGNHMLGILSIEAMEAMRQITTKIIHSTAGSIVLLLSILIHFIIAMRALYSKPILKLPRWQQLQLISGIAMILLLIPHAVAVRGLHLGFNLETSYPLILQHLWHDPQVTIRQISLLIVAWLHICLGLHFWLRTKSWYRKHLFWIYALAILWPTLALIGFVQAGYESFEFEVVRPNDPHIAQYITNIKSLLLWAVTGISMLMILLNWFRKKLAISKHSCTI